MTKEGSSRKKLNCAIYNPRVLPDGVPEIVHHTACIPRLLQGYKEEILTPGTVPLLSDKRDTVGRSENRFHLSLKRSSSCSASTSAMGIFVSDAILPGAFCSVGAAVGDTMTSAVFL